VVVADLSSKVALVTGGASGLGKAIAQRLRADAAAVVISDVDRELGQETARAGGFTFFEHDVCDEARWRQVIEEIERRLGRLDILVNNAGILGPMDAANPENTRLADWKRIFAVNVDGVLLGCQAAIAAMRRAGGGSIINISSVAGLMASPHATAYGATKATVRQLTKSIAQHCAQQRLNIRCNSIHPGNLPVGMWRNYAQENVSKRGVSLEELIEEAKQNIPMGEFTLPEDVAAAVSFLASDESRHMTGTKLIVDGGLVNCETYRPASSRTR
jgi:3(or 17)beta-hydroxysteroid dehydrogenase